MKAFKQISGYRYRRSAMQPLWQKGYYDHALRKEEDVNQAAEYIFTIRCEQVWLIRPIGIRSPGGPSWRAT